MVDMANAIDFRLGYCNGEFHVLWSKKVGMDYSCPHGNYSILVVFRYMYMASYKKNPRTGTKLSNFSTLSGFSQKPETSKAHRNNSRNIVTREKSYFASK